MCSLAVYVTGKASVNRTLFVKFLGNKSYVWFDSGGIGGPNLYVLQGSPGLAS